MKLNKIILALLLSVSFLGFSQEETEENSSDSNIQTYTPSKLLNKGQWDIKFFNGLYTQLRNADENGDISSRVLNAEGELVRRGRTNFFTSTLEVFLGTKDDNRVNIGAIIEYRSNTLGGDRYPADVFKFNNSDDSRNGFSSLGLAIKFQPLKNVSNFSVQSVLHAALNDDAEGPVFLDQSAWTFQNRFFYDYTFPSNKFQLFGELNTEYNFGSGESFANETLILAPSVFISYFPTSKTTVLAFVQHSERVKVTDTINNLTQDFTAAGVGCKYQLTNALNLEFIYSRFLRGTNSGIGESVNIGIRALL